MILALHALFFAIASAGETDTFPKNTIGKGPGETFVHLFEWSWDDVAKECEDWLAPKGFTAVQISPPNEHDDTNDWNARYKPVSYKLISRSGNETQFKSMVSRCNAVGVDIYADVVINQMAGPWAGVGVAGTKYGSRYYPPDFGPDDFHHFPWSTKENCGVDNYDDAYNVQYCDLLGMPDLCTGCPYVQDKLAAYMNHMYDLGVKGVRIDAAKHQYAGELKQVLDKINPKLYRFLEVFSNPGEAIQPPPYFPLGQVTEFGVGYTLSPAFTGANLLTDHLASFGAGWGFMPSEQAVVFVDNHDTQRSTAPLTFQKQVPLYVLVNIFMLAFPFGYPKVMSSYYFTDANEGPPDVAVHGEDGLHCFDGLNWVCEHRWTPIANMVNWRKSAADLPVTKFVASGNTVSFCRGDKACVAINKQAQNWTVKLSTSMKPGAYCNIIRSDDAKKCPVLIVLENGQVEVTVPRMSAIAFHVGKPTISNLLSEQPLKYSVELPSTVSAIVVMISLSSMAFAVFRRAGYGIRCRQEVVDTRPLL